jgi:hypothetical protein
MEKHRERSEIKNEEIKSKDSPSFNILISPFFISDLSSI